MQLIVTDVGGERDGRKVAHPLAEIDVARPSDEMASVDLWGSGNGCSPDFLNLVARVGADITRLPAGGLRGEPAPARCLKSVTGSYKMGKVERHHKPPPDMPLTCEETLTPPHAMIRCSYVGKENRNAHLWVGDR